ncbi:MAG: hypothetical protein K0Q83_3342 [Deltaproteobacteria bacterium]|jgi:hypothetical protein|nr:hypothetical protein [Deltaproteobacteria bacterium]
MRRDRWKCRSDNDGVEPAINSKLPRQRATIPQCAGKGGQDNQMNRDPSFLSSRNELFALVISGTAVLLTGMDE